MELKNINAMPVLYFSTETKITDLEQYVVVIGERLKKDAAAQNLTITGDQQWMYYDFKNEPDALFTLEIAFPIAKLPENYTGEYAVKTLPEYKCVSNLHKGHWLQLPETYKGIRKFMEDNNIQPADHSREIYKQVDMDAIENCITEVQFGVN